VDARTVLIHWLWLLSLHLSRTSVMSTSDGRCRLSGSRFGVLDFRFVVESGVGPDADNRK